MVYPRSFKRDELKKAGIVRIADNASLFPYSFKFNLAGSLNKKPLNNRSHRGQELARAGRNTPALIKYD